MTVLSNLLRVKNLRRYEPQLRTYLASRTVSELDELEGLVDEIKALIEKNRSARV